MDMVGAQPVYEVGGNGANDMMGGSGMWILFLFVILAFAGNGFGGLGGGNATANTISNDFLYTNLNNTMQNGFLQNSNQNFAIRTDLSTGLAGVNAEICQTNFNMQNGMSNLQHNQDMCCCTTNRNIDSVKFENAMNTTTITNTIRDEGNATRALITENLITELREQLNDAKRASAICTQNDELINRIAPIPIPSYTTCSPWEATLNNVNGCRSCGF